MAIKLKSGSGFRMGGPTGIKRKLIRETIYKPDLKPNVGTIVKGVMPHKDIIRVKGRLPRLLQKSIWKGMKGQIKEESGGFITAVKRRKIKAMLKSFNVEDSGEAPKSARVQADRQVNKKGEVVLTEHQKRVNVRLGRIGDKIDYLKRYRKVSSNNVTVGSVRKSGLERVSKEHLGIEQEKGGFASDFGKASRTGVASPEGPKINRQGGLSVPLPQAPRGGRRPLGL